MSIENLGPYTNFHELNQDWFLQEFNKLVTQWKAMQKNFDTLQDAFNDLKSYVQDYFKNLDVQKEINNKLDSMIADGTLLTIISPTISSATSNWLDVHITNPSNPPIDKSLSVENSAADAKITGKYSDKTLLSYTMSHLNISVSHTDSQITFLITCSETGYIYSKHNTYNPSLINNKSVSINIPDTWYGRVILLTVNSNNEIIAYYLNDNVPATSFIFYAVYVSTDFDTIESVYNPLNLDAEINNINKTIDNIVNSNINILENVEQIIGEFYTYQSHNISTNSDFSRFKTFTVEKGITYYYRGIFANFSSIYYPISNKYKLITTTTQGFTEGSFVPEHDGIVGITASKSSSYNDTLFTTSKQMYDNNIFNTFYTPNKLNVGLPSIYHVEKDNSGDFTKLTDAILKATEKLNSTVYLGAGIWDIIEELGEDYIESVNVNKRGLYLKNNIHLICHPNSYIKCEYEGTNDNTKKWLSAFNSGVNGFTLENANIITKNCRYCVHDERDSDTDFYTNRYINCTMFQDNTNNESAIGADQCIGGGLGKNGCIIIDSCVFDGLGEYSAKQAGTYVSYHNSASENSKSIIILKNSYFKNKAGARFDWYGQSKEITTAIVNGCSFGRDIVNMAETSDGTSPYENIKVNAWNNIVR